MAFSLATPPFRLLHPAPVENSLIKLATVKRKCENPQAALFVVCLLLALLQFGISVCVCGAFILI